jgi:quinol monooxygenase YgiN
MYAQVIQFSIGYERLTNFIETLNSAIPLMRKQNGFRTLLVSRLENSNPPNIRVMTIWTTQQALHESESNLQLYQLFLSVLAFTQGFPMIREEEVVLHDFGNIAAAAAPS